MTETAIPFSTTHLRREDSMLVFRVLGSEGHEVWLQSPKQPDAPIIRSRRELVEDGWVACDADGNSQLHAPIPFSTTHLYDRQQAQVIKVLGTGFGPTEFLAQTPGVHFEGDGEARWFNWSTLLHGDRFVAACEHGMPLTETCSACATVTEVVTLGMHEPFIHPVARAAAAMSELGRVLREQYTLDPTHTAACHLSEFHELCIRIPRGAPSDAVMPCVFEQRVAVRRWLVRQRSYAMIEGRTFAGKPVTDSDLSSL